MRILPPLFCVLLLVSGVSGVEMKTVTLSVMKGDTVTLKPDDAEIRPDERILWKFQGSIIVNMKNLKDGVFSTFDVADRIIKEKLLLDNQTGSLTITGLTTDNTGLYQLEIKSPIVIFKNYSVTVHGGMKTVSVKKGENVTLHTGLIEIKGYDLILWKSEGHLMAEINRTTNQFLLFSAEGKFEGRLQREQQSGSLTISDSKTTDSGDYNLHMSNSAYTLQRTISVTVTVLSLLEIVLIVIVVVFLFIIIVMVVIIHMKIGWKRLCCKKGGAIQNPSATELLS